MRAPSAAVKSNSCTYQKVARPNGGDLCQTSRGCERHDVAVTATEETLEVTVGGLSEPRITRVKAIEKEL